MQLVKTWLDEIQRRDLKVEGSIFTVKPNRLQGNRLQLVVNFDDQLISLFKEVRNLAWMDVQVPASITSVANVSKAVYPYAVSLFETVRTYQATNARVEANATVALLVAGHHKRIQGLISAGTPGLPAFVCKPGLTAELSTLRAPTHSQAHRLGHAVCPRHQRTRRNGHQRRDRPDPRARRQRVGLP